ncbi:4Fe-4S binding protein [bacterium]|nr:4Fe-4S binding protein [bacterium]
MDTLVAEIRQKAEDLLSRKVVSMVLGFTRGNLPMVTRPCIVRSPEDADLLWWDDFCVMNLAAFIPPRHEGKIGVFAKRCDLRNLVILNSEKKINLHDDFYIMGIPCHGMLDSEKVRQAVPGNKRIESVTSGKPFIEIMQHGGSQSLERHDMLRESCLTCSQTSPDIVDEWITGPADPEPLPHDSEQSPVIEPDRDAESFDALFSECIRCYACREACPSCYCETCFVDKAGYLWQGPDIPGEKNSLDFHFFRAFHMLGRCTDCGACESACPVHIPVRQLVLHLKRGNAAFQKYEPGLNPSLQPPDACFCPAIHNHRK